MPLAFVNHTMNVSKPVGGNRSKQKCDKTRATAKEKLQQEMEIARRVPCATQGCRMTKFDSFYHWKGGRCPPCFLKYTQKKL